MIHFVFGQEVSATCILAAFFMFFLAKLFMDSREIVNDESLEHLLLTRMSALMMMFAIVIAILPVYALQIFR